MKVERARMDFMTWQAMYGNGRTIGTMEPIIKIRHHQILRDLNQGYLECCEAALGTSLVMDSVLRTVAAATRRVTTTASVFVVPVVHPRRGLTIVQIIILHSWLL